MFRYIIKCFALLVVLCSLEVTGIAQERGYVVGYKASGRDTVYQIKINDLYLFSRPKNRKNNKEWREYYRLVYNFKKTYPYALLAKEKINEADSALESKHFNSREREKFIKSFESKLFRDFEKPLRKMSFSQGKLLLRLIDREVGQSSYSLIKSYKGGLNAGFWQGIARIFGSDLKQPYDKFGSDKLTEELVIMYQNGSFDYLYYSLYY